MMGGDFLAGRIGAAEMKHVFTESVEQYKYLSAHFDAVQAREKGERGASLTATLAGGVDEGLITREQAIGILVILFGAAGESTASLLGSAIRLLAMDPSLQAELRAAPALIPNFIEEVVRLETPFKFHYRVVKSEPVCAARPCGQAICCYLDGQRQIATRKSWEHPDKLKLDRAKPERHLGFGYGIHFCIGAPLARLEVRVALEEFLAGTQRIELDPERPPAFAQSIFVRRLQHLHLRVA